MKLVHSPWSYLLGDLFVIVTLQLTKAEVANVNGDIYIAGLFEIQTNDGEQCGAIDTDSVMTLEATRWYIERLNMNNALPFKIGKMAFQYGQLLYTFLLFYIKLKVIML